MRARVFLFMIAVASVHLLIDWSGIELAFDGEGIEFQWIGWYPFDFAWVHVHFVLLGLVMV